MRARIKGSGRQAYFNGPDVKSANSFAIDGGHVEFCIIVRGTSDAIKEGLQLYLRHVAAQFFVGAGGLQRPLRLQVRRVWRGTWASGAAFSV